MAISMKRKYTDEHIQFLKDNIKGCEYKVLANMINLNFGTQFSADNISRLAYRNGLKNGRNTHFTEGNIATQFKKGHTPHNKGKHFSCPESERTQFKKGNKPWNYKPVGSERVSAEGYLEVKIEDPRKWKMKHLIIWEQQHGPIPKGYVVIFADRNKQNLSIENLIMVSRKELLILNRRKLITNNSEITKTGVNIAKIAVKIGDRKKEL